MSSSIPLSDASKKIFHGWNTFRGLIEKHPSGRGFLVKIFINGELTTELPMTRSESKEQTIENVGLFLNSIYKVAIGDPMVKNRDNDLNPNRIDDILSILRQEYLKAA